MEISNQTKIEHLLSRAGFGATATQLEDFKGKSPEKVVKWLLKDADKYESLSVIDEKNTEVIKKKALRNLLEMKGASPNEIKEKLKEARETITDLNFLWIQKMASGEAMLREKMTLFWHGHFACRIRRPLAVQLQNNTLRKYALGKFGDLLMAIAQDPAMLQFLNNQQNKKNSPNENFAREVMELFTLGRGNYTEQDIKEAARAFTGWTANLQGEFVFRTNQHDSGSKTFQGRTGNFNGEDILKIILQNPQTALFISTKIYRYFVNENVDNQAVKDMAKRFQSTNYDIADLMEYVFKSDWFYRSENIGTRIKSPIELLVGLQRKFSIDFQQKQSVLFVQKSLGQILFYPPNVSGWSGGKNWIDSSTLMTRMKLPEIIFKDSEISFKTKDDGDADTEHLSKRINRMQAFIDWNKLQNQLLVGNQNLVETLEKYLLLRPLTSQQKEMIVKKMGENNTGIEAIKTVAQAITSLPEYQLC